MLLHARIRNFPCRPSSTAKTLHNFPHGLPPGLLLPLGTLRWVNGHSRRFPDAPRRCQVDACLAQQARRAAGSVKSCQCATETACDGLGLGTTTTPHLELGPDYAVVRSVDALRLPTEAAGLHLRTALDGLLAAKDSLHQWHSQHVLILRACVARARASSA